MRVADELYGVSHSFASFPQALCSDFVREAGAQHKVLHDAMVQSATSLGGGLGSASLETNTATLPA